MWTDEPDVDRTKVPSRVRPARLLGVLLALSFLYLIANFVDVWVASGSSSDSDASAAIVLGAAQYNGEPSPVLQGRLDLAAELYDSKRVEFVVVTGGSQAGDVTTEAKASYDYLRLVADIPDEQLKLEVQGTSTYESLAAASRFLGQSGLTDVLLVTDPYHARRSELVAREVGLQADAVITNADSSLSRLIRESGAVAAGRIIGFRRLERLQ